MQENNLLCDQVKDLPEKIHALEGRLPSPPEWAKADVSERPAGPVRLWRGSPALKSNELTIRSRSTSRRARHAQA